MSLTHLDEQGRARMVDITQKPVTEREARAEGHLRMLPDTLARAERGDLPKGDVRAVAEIAGVMAAKRTAELIPMCHPLALSSIRVTVEPDAALPGYVVVANVRCTGSTGVEMEALTAVSVACLTLYDMLKAVERTMSIGGVRVVEKHGGRSGDYVASSVEDGSR